MDTVDTGHIRAVSWTLSGALHTRRDEIDGVVEQTFCWDPNEQEYMSMPGQGGESVSIIATMPGAVTLRLRPALVHGEIDDTSDLWGWPECRDHWDDLTYAVHDNKIRWSYELYCGGLAPGVDPIASGIVDVELDDWPAMQHPTEGMGFYEFGELHFEKALPFSITVSAKLRLMAGIEHTDCFTNYPDEIWQCHTIDKDTCWLTGRRVVYAEVLDVSDPTAAHVSCTVGGENVIDADLGAEDYDDENWDVFYTNTDRVDATVRAVGLDDTRHTVGGVAATLAVTRTGNLSSDYGSNHWESNGWELDTAGGTITATMPAMEDLSNQTTDVIVLSDRCGPYSVTYNGEIAYVDGAPLIDDCEIQSNECVIAGDPPDGSCDGNISWMDGSHTPIGYGGWWLLRSSVLPEYEHKDVYDINLTGYDYPFSYGIYRAHGPLTVTDASLDALGEPRRNIGLYDAYADRRIPLSIGQSWAGWNALKVSTETSLRIIDCGDEDPGDWTVTHGSGSIQPDEGGSYLQILISSDGGSAARSFTDGENMQGARFCEIEIDGPAGEIEVEVSGRRWTIEPGASTIDLLCPHSASGFDTATQSMLPVLQPDNPAAGESDCSWGWGVYEIKTFKLLGLREGLYKLRGLKLKRQPAQDGGRVRVIAEPQAAWAEGRQTDDLTMPETGEDTYRQRVGLIVIDGVVAGELVQIKYSYDDRAGWDIDEELLSSDQWRCFPEPNNGFFTVSQEGTGAKVPAAWRHVGQVWGEAGGYNNVIATGRLMTDELLLPISGGPCNWLTMRKGFRGRTLIRVVDDSGKYVKRRIRVYGGSGAHEVDEELTTDELGFALGPAITHLDDCHVEVLDADPVVSAAAPVRNRYLGVITIKAPLAEEPVVGQDTDFFVDQLTGVGLLAYTTDDGELWVRQTFDVGATFADPVLVTDSGSPARPCVLLRPDSIWPWGLVWTEGSSVKLAWSADGFVNYDAETIMTGISNVRASIHPLTGVMIVAGWNDTSESITAATSYDYGITLTSPLPVVEVPEQAFGLTFAPTTLNTWCISCRNSGGDIRVYWSNDNGGTWQPAQ